MQTQEQVTEHNSFGQADEVRTFPRGGAEILTVGGAQSCEAPHFTYHASGRIAFRMDDGTEFVAGPGDVTSLPKGHDAWVVGDEPAIVVDWFGASNYAKPS